MNVCEKYIFLCCITLKLIKTTYIKGEDTELLSCCLLNAFESESAEVSAGRVAIIYSVDLLNRSSIDLDASRICQAEEAVFQRIQVFILEKPDDIVDLVSMPSWESYDLIYIVGLWYWFDSPSWKVSDYALSAALLTLFGKKLHFIEAEPHRHAIKNFFTRLSD